MFKNILNKLEDPKTPLLGPNIKCLKFWGLLLRDNTLQRYLYFLLHAFCIIFIITEYIDLWFINTNMNLVMNNMKVTLLSTINVFKVTTFIHWQKKWKSIIDYITKADLAQRNTSDVIKKSIVKKYTQYCRKITYMYWFLLAISGAIMIFTPILKYGLSKTYRNNVRNGTEKYIEVIMSWVPFDKNTVSGYLAASAYQTFATIYGAGWIVSFDTNAMVMMVFFKSELELLKIDSTKIYGSEKHILSEKVAIERLKECRRRHVDLVKYASLFDSCLSPIMLLYMFVCSVMLCVTAYQITTETSTMQKFLTSEYLVLGVAQLFVYCWHSNDVLYTSQDLMMGPYQSKWWLSNAKKRKDLYILIAQFNKIVVFSAGPFAKLTMATFISIIKGAYSYYTLLSKSDQK